MQRIAVHKRKGDDPKVDGRWIQYRIQLPGEQAEWWEERLAEAGYTWGWVEPALVVFRTDNGFGYEEQPDAPVTAYVFEQQTDELAVHAERLRLAAGCAW